MERNIFTIVILVVIIVILFIIQKIYNKYNMSMHCVQKNVNLYVPESKFDTLILYYANWCGFSKQFLPEWAIIKQKIETDLNKQLQWNEVDCSENMDICKQYNIKGFPAIILHKINGEYIKYPDDQPRKLESIFKYFSI